jgi:activating signal cointegrator complex subunit 3
MQFTDTVCIPKLGLSFIACMYNQDVIFQDCRGVQPTSMGRIASFYYLSHQTMQHFQDSLRPDLNLEQLLKILSDAHEYDQLPVRHNEDGLNG